MEYEYKVECTSCSRAQTVVITPGQLPSVSCPGCGIVEKGVQPLRFFGERKIPIYRVYDAKLTDGEPVRFCCSNVREVSLRKDIESGEMLILPDSLVLFFETFSRNEARSMATEF